MSHVALFTILGITQDFVHHHLVLHQTEMLLVAAGIMSAKGCNSVMGLGKSC